MKTLNEWQYEIDAQGKPNYFFDTLTEASQKLHLELREVKSINPLFNDMADLAMSINRILVELQHTGEISDRTAWQCKFHCWKCENIQENWIHGSWGNSVKRDIKLAVESFLKLADRTDRVPPAEMDDQAKSLIKQSAASMKGMVEQLDAMGFWKKRVTA